jgi:type I restriction enzyme S subunit
MNRIIQVKDIAELNLATYKKDDFPSNVKYLDTSSLTKNRIENFQFLDTNTDVVPSRAQRKVKQNTILYSTVRPNQEHYGIIERLLENIVVSTGFTTLDVIDEEISPKYLFYLLTQPHITDYLHTIATNSVSAYPSILPNDIGNLKFRVPELVTQQKIASVLSALDSKIELNNRINAELEAMAKTLYDYWFVQFDFPDKNGKPYKTSGGKMAWNDELKREIPQGWEDGCFGDYAKLKGGFAFKSSWWTEAGLPVIKIKDINEDYTLSIENCSCVNEDRYSIAKNYEVHPGDVVIALTGATVGKYGIVTKSEKQVLVNQRVGFFKLGEMPLNKLPFLINSLNQEYFRKTVFVLASGAAQPNISTDQIDEIPLIIPKSEIIKRYNETCKSFYEVNIKNQTENRKLTELRDWLLPMLMNGQVKVN